MVWFVQQHVVGEPQLVVSPFKTNCACVSALLKIRQRELMSQQVCGSV